MSTHVTFLLSRFQQYCQSGRSQLFMYPLAWHWWVAPLVPHTQICHVSGRTLVTSIHRRLRGHAEMEIRVGTFPSVMFTYFYDDLRNNENIYNLYKKFLLDGDRFLCFCSNPTLHPGSWSGSSDSSSSLGRAVVVCFCLGESTDFDGCWMIGWRVSLILLRWSIALCWWSLRWS